MNRESRFHIHTIKRKREHSSYTDLETWPMTLTIFIRRKKGQDEPARQISTSKKVFVQTHIHTSYECYSWTTKVVGKYFTTERNIGYQKISSLLCAHNKLLPTPWVVAWVDFSAAFVCLPVCLSVFFHTISQKTNAASITKLNTKMVHHESWKSMYFGLQRSRSRWSRSRCTETLSAWVMALLWMLVSSSYDTIVQTTV